jgi:hypothetical protein
MNPLIQAKGTPLIALLFTCFAQRFAFLAPPTNLRFAILAGFCGLLLGCPLTPDTTEKTPPTITVTVQDRLNNNAQTVLQPNGLAQFDPQFDIFIIVVANDPGGMKELDGNVYFVSNSCGSPNNVGNVYYDSIDNLYQVATVSPQNTVPDELLYLHEVKTADVQALPCGNGFGGTCSGVGSIVVNVAATNQSNRTAGTNQYIIRIGNGALPPH